METHTEETVTTERSDTDQPARKPARRGATGSQTLEYAVYFIFGILEILLAFRLVLKLLGASSVGSFVSFIYNVSGAFIWPFLGIFHSGVTEGVETIAIFEPATLIAILVYAIVAWGIVKLVVILSGEKQE